MAEFNSLDYAGQIEIEELKLVSVSSLVVDLESYLVEISIYEDIFSNFLHGQILLSDSFNLISKLPLIGEEYLIVKFRTPSLDMEISKTFKVYSITDRKTVRDNNTQLYVLHFCSLEAIVDIANPLYKPFEGKITDVISNIFTEFLELPRTYTFTNNSLQPSAEGTPLKILNNVSNKVKFISPGWTSAKCINWLASKAIPEKGKACDYLFWESTQAFYFGNIEKIYSDTIKSGLNKGVYIYYPPNVGPRYNVIKKFFAVEEFEVIKTVDNLKNYGNGYLANRLYTLDIYNKRYEVTDFDYVNRFYDYDHTNRLGQHVPLFTFDTIRNPATYNRFYPVNKKMYTGMSENVDERIKDIHGNRTSRLHELNNFIIQLTVPGRTDLEAGSMISFIYPDVGDHSSSSDEYIDKRYSGNYIITAINHKINLKSHKMIMELSKDSLEIEDADQ